jgi:hypothetical protein
MDWNNLDLEIPEGLRANILDAYTVDTLLLEVDCNLPIITEDTIRAQFQETLRLKIESAHFVLEANLKNILRVALKNRNLDDELQEN